jgi:hypothetical protein
VTQVETHVHDEGCCPGRHRVPRGQPCPRRQPVWCPACTALIVRELGRLPELVALLVSRDDGRVAPGVSAGRPPRPTEVVSPSPAQDAANEIERRVRLLETRLRAHLQEPAPPPRLVPGPRGPVRIKPVFHLSTAVGYLTARSTALLSWDTRSPGVCVGDVEGPAEAQTVGLWVLTAVRNVERLSGRDVLVHRLVAPCPRCDTFALTRRDGEDQVRCAVCHNAWPEEHYQLLVRILAGEEIHDAQSRG